MPTESLPAPVMAFAIEPKTKGDEDKVFTSLRRLQEEDPTIDLHRDPQTGQQIVAGLSQIHVEVIVDRLRVALRRRGHAEAAARPLPGDDPRRRQGPRTPQEAVRRARPVRRLPHRDRAARAPAAASSSSTASRAARSPARSSPPSRRACARRWSTACSPATRSRMCASRSSTAPSTPSTPPSSRSSSRARMAMKQALEQANPVLLEPIMLVTLSVPEETVGDVIGDLNSRRGRPQGMEPNGAMTEIKAELPMAELLGYAPGPALDHRRPGRLHDGVPALRGGPRPPRLEGPRAPQRRSRCASERTAANAEAPPLR